MTKQQLEKLRKEVVLGSLYYSDYANSFEIDTHVLCDFFDGYLEELQFQMAEEIEDYTDEHFFDYISEYDNIETLFDYYELLETVLF